ncbi:FAD-dependent oxidoreductase [Sneathiella sp. CAU 1612]|uniref:FAD-dependent oxidoreductase n=1 Tax=Sneathiella sedimenti TaxID=2816034 RepID=A0ABS3F2S4_9PROT|nr:FAD-dependent oxidoreductase [Sneathiella sedimenti]MBO0332820.1 FAD-dependent oxidoreductase [Sneathiella sedimenti]
MHYQNRKYPFRTPPELMGEGRGRYPVAIIGAGPIGMAMAIDLALHGIRSVILDDNNMVSVGSRAICWAKRTLEIFDRLGIGDRMLEKGVTWKVGRLFHGKEEVYNFDLLPDDAHKMPAFVNLQQYYVEEYLVDRIADFPDLIDLRWLNKVTGEEITDDGVALHVKTSEGNYWLSADYVLACDGCKSQIRQRMGLAFEGQTFEEHFLITDVEMPEPPFESETPERWFWFKPPFHSGQSALLHKQPDNIYRIDLQLGPDTDPTEEAKPEQVIPRVKQIIGDRDFKIDWVSVYSFTCAMLEKFVHGRIIFVGDSAHVVSPFGARGGNGGIQDVDNLGWKLAAVLKGEAEPALLESYDEERRHGARENIKNSARATNFMTPKSKMEAMFRDAVLNLASDLPFARRLVNSGRLSFPCSLEGFTLQSPHTAPRGLAPGTPCPDAPLEDGWLLNQLGKEFILLTIGARAKALAPSGVKSLHFENSPGVIAQYGDDMIYLIRPDQHIAAAFEAGTDSKAIERALVRATGSLALETAI